MKIRSITVGIKPEWPLKGAQIKAAGAFIQRARQAITEAGYEVQTARLATIPFPHLFAGQSIDGLIQSARALQQAFAEQGFDYISLGPALPELPDSYKAVIPVLEATENIFLAGKLNSAQEGISLPAVHACAEIIQRAAGIEPNGFGNLYFAALANVSPGAPFFPAAYHRGERPAFALATEAADLAVRAFETAGNPEEARKHLIEAVEGHASRLEGICSRLADQFDIDFNGLDFTLAPFPEESLSLGSALERLGVPAVGMHGSLAGAAFLADTLDRADYKRIGFNGFFLPVLEDATLAKRAAEGLLGLNELLLYSAVCGTGLDTVPLPGDTSKEEIYAVLLDLAALSLRLGKPLTARLMPVPGKKAGDATGFDFEFFANSRVLPLRASPLSGVLRGAGSLPIAPRPDR